MGAENKLSDKRLKNLLGKTLPRQQVISDGKGLSVRVSKTGTVSFVFFYRLGSRESAPVWLTLGKYPDMSLQAARGCRNQCRTWLAEGTDPRNRMMVLTEETLKPVTVKDALEYWLEYYAKPVRRTWQKCEERFKRYIYQRVGNVPLTDCSASMWVRCFDEIKKTAPVGAGHTFRDVKQALKFCRVRRFAISTELEDFGVSDMGARAKKRDRVLTADELADVWKYANMEVGNRIMITEHRMVMVLLTVFGCRSREVRESCWEEWNLKEWIWKVPKEHSKNGKEIIRPIPPQLRQWLVNLKAIADSEKRIYLMGEVSRKQQTLSTIGGRLWCKMKHKKSWCLHDMRRVLATNLNDMGVDPHVVEQLLGHTLPGVMGIYNRSQYMDEKLRALTMWCDYLNSLIQPSEVAA